MIQTPRSSVLSQHKRGHQISAHLNVCLCLMMSGVVWSVFGVGCDDPSITNLPPSILPIQEQIWRVNESQSLEIFAQDPEGDRLTFSFEFSPLPMTQTAGATGVPSIQTLTSDKAIFQWTPGVADVGVYSLTFQVQDSRGGIAAETIRAQVEDPGIQGSYELAFVEPQGAGRSFDLSFQSCIEELEVRIKADAIPDDEVFISLEEPVPVGATLFPSASVPSKERRFSWCPTQEQLDAQDRYIFTLHAYRLGREDRGVRKRFLIRFERPNPENCAGHPPVIEHEHLTEVSGLADYYIEIRVLDDFGIKSPPLLSYLIDPAYDPRSSESNPMNADWTLMEFEYIDAERWITSIPNLNLTPDQSAKIYYFVIATDNDDQSGATCDQTTQSPIYLMTATGGGDQEVFGLCDPCSHHDQCAGVFDLCVRFENGQFCTLSCDSNQMMSTQCPTGTECHQWVTSNGDTISQCLPISGECISSCEPDHFDQDPMYQEMIPILDEGRDQELSICGEDLDFYWVRIPAQRGLDVSISFATGVDLDLAVALNFTPEGEPIYEYQSAEGNNTEERITIPCLEETRDALIVVYPYQQSEGDYTLNVQLPHDQCVGGCVNDPFESEDPVTVMDDIIEDLKICPEDRDRYVFFVNEGWVISLMLTFDLNLGDLDLILYDVYGNELERLVGPQTGALLEYRTTREGEYMVEIFGATPLVQNTYTFDLYLFESQECEETIDCPAGTICDSRLGCVTSECSRLLSCGNGHACVYDALQVDRDMSSRGVCGALCVNDEMCRRGERCKLLPTYEEVCIELQTQTVGIGEHCRQHSECEDALACVEINGQGYCLDSSCDSGITCFEEQECLILNTQSFCVPSCTMSCPGVLQCREISGLQLCYP